MCAAEKRAQVCEEFQFRSGNTVRDTNGFLIRRALCGREIHNKDKDMNAPRTRATTKTTTTVCQMCDIALEYDALSAEFLASRKVQCGRCTFVNDIRVDAEEKTKTKTAASSSSEGVKGDEAFARRLQKEEDARGSHHRGRSFGSWMKDLFSALPLPQEEAKKRPPRCAKCERTVTDVGVFDPGERVTQNNVFSRTTTTVRYYQTSEYWNEFLCRECFEGERRGYVVRCDGCQKIESERCKRELGGFVRLPEEEQGPGNAGADGGGRYLCLECSGSVVVDNEDAWILYEEIKQFMMNELDLTMPERMPPLHVVTEESMRLSMGRDQNTTAHVYNDDDVNDDDRAGGGVDFSNTRTRGLCLSTEHTLTRVVRRPEFSWREGLTFSETPIHVGSRSNVTAIIVVNCLPRLLFGSILAHEMTHAHFRLTPGYPRKINRKVEEGLCQLIACLWTEREAQKIDGNDEEAKNQLALAGCIAHNIRNEPSEIYGDGARIALHRYEKLGNCRDVFDCVKSTGQFPEYDA